MSKLTVSNLKGESVGSVEISDSITKATHSPQVLQDAIVAYRANQRSGNHSTLTKGEVAGSGKKPWRQKGTGRARAGYKQSPIWRGGGVVFGPKPRDYSKPINHKSGHAALRLAFGQKINDGAVTVIDAFDIKAAKTKEFVAALKSLKLDRGLVVVEKVSHELGLASRNISDVEVCEARNLNSYQVLRHARVVVTQAGLVELQKRIAVAAEAA
jgi:large subunit ribosomal protein L4